MSNFDILYPPKERQSFDGGKNNKFEKHLIQDNESPECLNVIFESGDVQTRPGYTKANSTSVGSFSGDGLYTRNARNGTQTMVAWWNGGAFAYTANTFVTIASAQSIFTAGVRVAAAEYENYMFFNNGSGSGYKYADTVFTKHGVPAPTTTHTVASGGTGILSGSFSYKITYVNSNLVESDMGPAFTFVASANQNAITSIPVAPQSFGVSSRNIYRTNRSTSSTTYFRVASLNNNTATTYTDNLADLSLGVEAPADQGEPPRYDAIITHQNRLFCNDLDEPNLVWYSEIDNPFVFKTTNFEILGDNSGDLVKGFAIHDNGLVVMTNKSQFMIYMPSTDPTTWKTVKLRSSYGSISPFATFTYNNKIMFPAHQNGRLVGFAAISGDAVDPEATLLTVSAAGSDMKSDRIEPDIFDIQTSLLSRISAFVYKNRGYISVAFGSGQTTNNRIYVFDFSISNLSKTQEASWSPWTGLNAEQFTELGGELYFQSSLATGFVYRALRSGVYSDDGTAINSYYWTKEFSGIKGDEQNHKDFRYANLLYEKSGAFYMNLNYKADSETGDGQQIQIDLDPGSSLWGSMIWGVDNWSGGRANGEEKIFFGQLRGKRIQLRFSNQNTINQSFKVIGLQFGYNRKGRR